jgi:hypothetical protein
MSEDSQIFVLILKLFLEPSAVGELGGARGVVPFAV